MKTFSFILSNKFYKLYQTVFAGQRAADRRESTDALLTRLSISETRSQTVKRLINFTRKGLSMV